MQPQTDKQLFANQIWCLSQRILCVLSSHVWSSEDWIYNNRTSVCNAVFFMVHWSRTSCSHESIQDSLFSLYLKPGMLSEVQVEWLVFITPQGRRCTELINISEKNHDGYCWKIFSQRHRDVSTVSQEEVELALQFCSRFSRLQETHWDYGCLGCWWTDLQIWLTASVQHFGSRSARLTKWHSFM